MNTATLNYSSPHNLEFTHNLDSHEYLRPRYGYKGFFSLLGLALFFFPVSLAMILLDWMHHASVGIDNLIFFFLSIFFGFASLLYFSFCQQTRPSKAIIWLPAKENNPQTCLHIRSQNWYRFLAVITFFFLIPFFVCAACSLTSISPIQVFQPWHWIRITPINLKADLMCLAADGALILFILLILFFTQWHIIYTPQTLHIYHHFPLLHRTTTHLNHSWEQLATTSLIQSNVNNPSFAYMRSTITLKDGQEKTFKLDSCIFADPCWMTFIANTLTNLPDTTSRQDFLTNLHQYVPPKAKTRYTKP